MKSHISYGDPGVCPVFQVLNKSLLENIEVKYASMEIISRILMDIENEDLWLLLNYESQTK